MFSRIVSLVTLTLPLLAVATPTGPPAIPASQCNTGPVQCCNTVQSASSPSSAQLLGLLGIVLQDLNVLLGINCSPISVIGIGGNSCSANPVCCDDNSVGGLISIGCVPVDLGL
ncbi:sc3 hydrophobin [Cerrena zonata]|uniref:Hydrophobin n=1 Tax=Cerrena zonata TaxID=2478898 RepID=A0AAW0GS35_9APHY